MNTIHSLLRSGTMAMLLATGWLAGCQSGSNPQQSGRGGSQNAMGELSNWRHGAPLVVQGELPKLGLRQYWHDRLQLLPGDKVQQASLLGDQLIVVTDRNFCFSVEAATGVNKCLAQIAPESAGAFLPPYFDGTHYLFAGVNRVVGLNSATGNHDLLINLEMPSRTRAISDKEFVYTGSLDGKTYAYSVDSQVKHWDTKVGPAVVGLELARGNLVIARSGVTHGEVVVIRPKMWNEVWQMLTEGPIRAPIVTTAAPDEAVFVASEDGSLYRFNSQHGWSEWRVRTPGILVDAPVILADYVVQIVPGNGTWVIGRSKGNVVWKDPETLRYLGMSKDKTRMYFFNGQSVVVKKPEGDKDLHSPTLATAPVRGNKIFTVPDADGTRLYLIDLYGEMLCLNDLNLPYLSVSPK